MTSKRLIILPAAGLILTLLMLFACTTAYAAEITAETMAASLKELGLFLGTNNGFELDKPCDRLMGAVILTRLLGWEQKAQKSSFRHPFVDVVGSYAEPYIGYLYQQGLVNGISAVSYGRDNMTAQQFATLTLRALGYADGKDFHWDSALATLAELGITGAADAQVLAGKEFLRKEAVLLCHRALTAVPKNEQQPLIHQMLWNNVFTTRQLALCKDASLLLAADMPDRMGFAVTVYTEQEFRDIFWLSLRNHQSYLDIYAPWLAPKQAESIIDELLSPYYERDFLFDSMSFSYDGKGVFTIAPIISEHMAMQFYYENPGRYEKNFQFYDEEFRQPHDGYISMSLWRDKLDGIVNSLIKPHMSDYERVKALHDYVALNTLYDDNADLFSCSHLAEGALYHGLAVCDGYAAALKMLLNAAGFESLVVYGDTPSDIHAWNQVKIGGKWFNVDVTLASTMGKGSVFYGYFCAPDSIFLRDHKPDNSGIVQICTSSEYYRQN